MGDKRNVRRAGAEREHFGDQFIDREIKAIIFKRDRNSEEYVRIIVGENVSSDGISYERDVSCLVFGDLVEKAKALTKGQRLQGIASPIQSLCGRKYKMHAITTA